MALSEQWREAKCTLDNEALYELRLKDFLGFALFWVVAGMGAGHTGKVC
jgi:hypothetical protein